MALKVGDLYAAIGLDRRDFDRGLAAVQAAAARLRDPSLSILIADDDAMRAIDRVEADLSSIRDGDATVRVDESGALTDIAAVQGSLFDLPDAESVVTVANGDALAGVDAVESALASLPDAGVNVTAATKEAQQEIASVRKSLDKVPAKKEVILGITTREAQQSLGPLLSRLATTDTVVGTLIARFGALRFAMSGTAAIAGGVLALALGHGVMAASDLNEQISAATALFGDAAKGVTTFADRYAAAFGTVRTQTIGATTDIGILLKGVGLADEHAVHLGTSFVRAAQDMESFRNVPLPQVLEAIRSGLVGETEPLRRFGINLNEASIEAEAVRLGLAKMGDELTDSAKAAARASLILKGLNVASGDLALTQESVANRVRELVSRLRNASDTIFTSVLPAASKLLGVLTRIAEGAAWLSTQISNNASMFGKLTRGIVDAIPPLKLISVGIDAIDRSSGNAAKTVNNADQAVALLGKTTGMTADEVRALAGELGVDLSGDVRKSVQRITEAWDEMAVKAGFANGKMAESAGLTKDQMKEIEAEVTQIGKAVGGAMESAASAVAHFANATSVSARDVRKFFAQQVKDAREWANNLAAAVRAGVDRGLVQQIAEAGPKAAPLLRGVLDEVRRNGVEGINQSQRDLRTIMGQTQDLIVSYTGPAGRAGQGVGTAAGMGMAGGILETQWQVDRSTGVLVGKVVERMHGVDVEAARAGRALPATMAGSILAGIGVPVGAAAELARLIQSNVAGAAANAEATGRNVSAGLGRGIEQGKPAVLSLARGLAADVGNILNHVAQVRSPSRMTMFTGRMIALGLAKGMDVGKASVLDAARSLAVASIPNVRAPQGAQAGAGESGGTVTHRHYHLSVNATETTLDETAAMTLFRRMEVLSGG